MNYITNKSAELYKYCPMMGVNNVNGDDSLNNCTSPLLARTEEQAVIIR